MVTNFLFLWKIEFSLHTSVITTLEHIKRVKVAGCKTRSVTLHRLQLRSTAESAEKANFSKSEYLVA